MPTTQPDYGQPNRAFPIRAGATQAGALLCADTDCAQRTRPSTEQLAEALSGTSATEARTTAWREYANERFAAQEARTDQIEAKLDVNVAVIQRVEASTAG